MTQDQLFAVIVLGIAVLTVALVAAVLFWH